ncbi:MAG: hypothetical protein OXQ89_22200 [Rhodospirillaceae bacterium]|nr:hypothetical protein [Rhodospirillaceae bacterium]
MRTIDDNSFASSLSEMEDEELTQLRAALDSELRKRELGASVGEVAERLAISFFNETPGLPNLTKASAGTAYVDALSRRGERYSIKGIHRGHKTGTVYPDSGDEKRQLFEYLLVVKLNDEWTLESIHEFDWPTFVRCRKWDGHMSAWYIGIAKKTMAKARQIF